MSDAVATDALSSNSQTKSAPPPIDWKPHIKSSQSQLAAEILESHFGRGEKRQKMTPAVGSSLVDAIGTTFSKDSFGGDEERQHFALLAARNGVAYPGHDVVGANGISYGLNRQHEQWASALLSAKTQFMRDGKFDSQAFRVYLATKLTSLAGRGKPAKDGKVDFNDQAIQGFENFLYLAREINMVGDDYLLGGTHSLTADTERIVKSWENNYEQSCGGEEHMLPSQSDEYKLVMEASVRATQFAVRTQDKMSSYRQSGNLPYDLGSKNDVENFFLNKGITKFGQDDVI